MIDSGVANNLENLYIFAGAIFLLASTVLAAFTYTGSNYRNGMSGRDLENNILDANIRPTDALYDTVEGYSEWAQHNFKVNTRLVPLSTAMLLSLIYGLVFLTTGVFHAILIDLGIVTLVIVAAILLFITRRSKIYGQLQRYWKYRDSDPGKD